MSLSGDRLASRPRLQTMAKPGGRRGGCGALHGVYCVLQIAVRCGQGDSIVVRKTREGKIKPLSLGGDKRGVSPGAGGRWRDGASLVHLYTEIWFEFNNTHRLVFT